MRPPGEAPPQARPVSLAPPALLRPLAPRPVALTHDGQGGGLAQLVPHGIDDLQPAPVQVAAVDGVVLGADPVEFALREVDRQAWKKRGVTAREPRTHQGWGPGA